MSCAGETYCARVPSEHFAMWVVKHLNLNQRRCWLYKVWAPSKSIIFWSGSDLPNWSESQTSLSSPRPNWSKPRRACNVMRCCSVLRKSSIRTTCNLRLWVMKHLNQRRWLLYKVWAPSESIIFDGLKYTNCCNPELESYRGTALAGFEPVTICFRDCFKMPRELGGGSSEKSLCWTQTCPSPCWSKSNSS